MTRRVHLKRPAGDKGYCWESVLLSRGFNDLPQDQQYGEIVEDGLYPLKVRWPALDNLESLVFSGEVLVNET
jgi:hypothetical protein